MIRCGPAGWSYKDWDVYVVTNNHFRGKAVANALMLRSMLEERGVRAPKPLRVEYGDLLEEFVSAYV